jgi:hypothetical protein
VIAVVLAVIAIGIAVSALLRPPPATAPAAPSAQQVADAKTRACNPFTTVCSAVALQTRADLGPDPVAVQAVAANARLSMAAGASYLLAHLDPPAPAPLAAAIRGFADDLRDIAMNALAGVGNDNPAQAARLGEGETHSSQIADLCKLATHAGNRGSSSAKKPSNLGRYGLFCEVAVSSISGFWQSGECAAKCAWFGHNCFAGVICRERSRVGSLQ